MKKTLLLLLIFTFFLSPFTSWSQNRFDAHVFGGLNMCQIDGDMSDGFSHPGLRAGVGTSFALGKDLNSPWRMVVELAFSNKGSYVKKSDQTLSMSYIEIPVMLSYNTLEDRLRIAAGIAPAYRLSLNVSTAGVEEAGWHNTARDFDWLPLTFSLRYRFTDHLGIEARYQYSALSITKNTGSGTYFLFRSNKGCFHNLVSFALSYTF